MFLLCVQRCTQKRENHSIDISTHVGTRTHGLQRETEHDETTEDICARQTLFRLTNNKTAMLFTNFGKYSQCPFKCSDTEVCSHRESVL